ncbi:MAG: cyclodeaminase/cyclohydrolase family protein [Candidatus Omnitrophica bacterium]|nr:cyclodeaminase/cyclohydrolase family protein [Candidatus Omnitrophota bacterium]MCM8770525.1 cyclodeaminase/cyclohydrolase family protein [Candidatus Omnitrophota bacterium]
MYSNSFLKKYLDDLAAKLPAPGGGSAAALVGALGCALVSMVCNFTLGKEKYKDVQEDIKEIFQQSEQLREELLELIDLDVEAYKSKDINRCLDIPKRICECCLEAIHLCPGLAKKGNSNLVSDVWCAVILLEAGFFSAYVNVLINLKFLKDKEKKDKIFSNFKPLLKEVSRIKKQVAKDARKIIGR